MKHFICWTDNTPPVEIDARDSGVAALRAAEQNGEGDWHVIEGQPVTLRVQRSSKYMVTQTVSEA